MVFTLIGWSLVLKSFLYLVFPRYGLKVLGRVSMERAWGFVIAGIFALGISGFLSFILLTRSTN